MGASEEVMDKLPTPFLQNLLEDIVQEEGIKNAKYTVTRGSAVGDNYVGVIYRVEISGDRKIQSLTDADVVGRKLSIIMKCMPEQKERKVFAKKFFVNEVNIYNEIISYYLKFQEEKNVPVDDRFKSVAKCYRAVCDDENGGVLVLEDMKLKGFQMKDRRKGLNAEDCFLVLRELGKYHAFSFALKDQRPEVFEKLKSYVKETIFDRSAATGSSTNYMEHCKKTALKLIVKLTHENSEQHEIFRRFCDSFQDQMALVCEGKEAEPYAVLCHGDCWSNNFLFKFKQGGASSSEAVCFLDFQLARYSSPVLDMSYLIYCCTTRQTRKESYNKMIDVYHESLSTFLRLLGSDPDKLFPKSILYDHLKIFSKFGLGMALVAMMLFTTDDAPDLDEIHSEEVITGEAVKSNDIYDQRMGGTILDMIDHGFIK